MAPFPEGLDWINSGPLQPADLRGKFVLLDFWTLGCINCMHVIPELKELEAKYPKELVVIGVHSAKFDSEKQIDNIREAAARYDLKHPVVNDRGFAIWNHFGVRAWPSMVLVDPQGFSVWAKAGEVTFEELDAVLAKAIPFYRRQGLLDAKPLALGPVAGRETATPLCFPGKVLADEPGGRLFIADSNHHRIVVTRLDGSLLYVIGSGAIGRTEGDFATARFHQPQGMALAGQTLYVADTENHLIRKVDLIGREVSTVAGTGEPLRQPPPFGHLVPPLRTALSSPWDVLVEGGDLYVAMAGTHQIWRMRPDGSGIGVYAGNGREDVVDGPLAPRQPYQLGSSSFAQPSGLASDGQWLYVADSEGSSIRAVPLLPRHEVRTVVGTAGLPAARLFTFGDVDGAGPQVRLQHPLAVACYQGRLFVADTYNNKIKVIDPKDATVRTLVGTGRAGAADDPPAFNEPGGIAAAAGRLFVADTNNHAIRVVDLANGNRVSTLSVSGLKPPAPLPQE